MLIAQKGSGVAWSGQMIAKKKPPLKGGFESMRWAADYFRSHFPFSPIT